MFRAAFLAVAAAATATAANAADLYIEPAVQVMAPTSSYEWTGFYAGANAGLASGTFEHPFDLTIPPPGPGTVLTGTADVTAGGLLGGVQAGYNWQMDRFVLGLEADIQAANILGQASASVTDTTGIIGAPGDTLNLKAGSRVDWFATIRPRLGYADGQWMVYATGGLAYANTTSFIDVNVNGGPSLFGGEAKRDRWGYTVGAGVEYALTDRLTLKTEYLYTDLGSAQVVNLGSGAFTMDSHIDFHTVRAGLNFQF